MIDAADPSSATWIPETDFNGAGRDGAAPDAGAYEFEGAGNPGWGLREGFKDVAAYAPRAAEVQGGCCKDAEESGAEGAAFFLGLAALGLRRRRASAD
jgi:MYXO-CTERM domain-containing protein